jgi:hypothetical protein
MKRVILQHGKRPIIIVAPHGYHEDDLNTEIIADVLATELQAYSVINTGWRRDKDVNVKESKANLNSLAHCNVKECHKEFLQPLMLYKDECVRDKNRAFVFYIHGMSNKIRHNTNDKVDIVLGFGQGNPPSYTCNAAYKNALVTRFREEKFNVYQAKVGGRFAAWNKDNIVQLWRRHFLDERVKGIQLEIANIIRSDPKEAVDTALRLTRAIDALMRNNTNFPRNIKINEY